MYFFGFGWHLYLGHFFADAKKAGCPFQARLFALAAARLTFGHLPGHHLPTLNKGNLAQERDTP